MPAFKYTSKANVPSQISGRRAQARSVSAPRLNAPQQQTVTMGGRVAQQAMREGPNVAALTVAKGVTDLGNMFFERSVQQADLQADTEANEAISRFRRSVSDRFYSEKDGLFSLTGAAGSRVYADHKGDIDAIRDGYAEGLSGAAKRKYLLKVQGYSNQYHDQLAKKQYYNGEQYRKETQAMHEGDQAADIFSFLKEGNVEAVKSTIQDDEQFQTDIEKQGYRDRMVMATMQSVDAQNLSHEEAKQVFDEIKHFASQNVQNQITEDLGDYKAAEKIAIEKAQKDYEDLIEKQQEENFDAITKGIWERNPDIDQKTILNANLKGEDRDKLLKAWEKRVDTSDKQAYNTLMFHASNGDLDLDSAKTAFSRGLLSADDYNKIKDENRAERERVDKPDSQTPEQKAAFDLVEAYAKDKSLSAIEESRAKRDLRLWIKGHPDEDPTPWTEQYLEPKVRGNVVRTFDGIFGRDTTPLREEDTETHGRSQKKGLMERYQHFTPLQWGAYEELKVDYAEAGKGNLDKLPEDEVEYWVNKKLIDDSQR